MNHFARLPVELLQTILSSTSPLDALRCAAISTVFRAAAESDAVWDRFLPHDCLEIVARSVAPVIYASRKELYLSLCHTPILLDGGNLSFSLERVSGKKRFMVGARKLVISWGDHPGRWEWRPFALSRFPEVARLRDVCWLDIRGKIRTQMLSSNTTYAAYLVFGLDRTSYGLESANAVVRSVNNEADGDAENRATVVHLQQAIHRQQAGQLPVMRGDGWMEIEMGSFHNDQGDDGEMEARLIEIERLGGKSGLIVEGIEFRPN